MLFGVYAVVICVFWFFKFDITLVLHFFLFVLVYLVALSLKLCFLSGKFLSSMNLFVLGCGRTSGTLSLQM